MPKIKFKKPVTFNGVEYKEVTLREPTGKDLEDFPIGSLDTMGRLYPLIAACADVDVGVIKALGPTDLFVLTAKVQDFLPDPAEMEAIIQGSTDS